MGIRWVTIAAMWPKTKEKLVSRAGLFVGVDSDFIEEEVFNGALRNIPEEVSVVAICENPELDFEGTLPPGGEPFLGPVFNIDASKPIRRALLSTSTEARGLFLIEHPEAPAPDSDKPTAVVTVVEVESIDHTLARAEAAGAPVSETVTDITPEGMRFSEAMITTPGGHAILVYELSKAP